MLWHYTSKFKLKIMLRNISFLPVTVFVVVGLFFKFMHWPGAALVVVGSLFLLSIRLLVLSFTQLKLQSKLIQIVNPVLGCVFVLSFVFKLMHWPGANILLILSFFGISLSLLIFAFKERKHFLGIFPVLFAFVLMSALFKILHWPHSTDLLLLSFCGFAALVPVFSAFRAHKQKNDSKTLSTHLFAVSLLSLCYFLMELYLVVFEGGLATGSAIHRLIIIFLLFFVLLVVGNVIRKKDLKSVNQKDFNFLQLLGVSYMILLVIQSLISAS